MITVAIPLYNSEKYIARCIKSVLAQSYTDLEILIVNDCCTDGSLTIIDAICRDYHGEKHLRIVNQPCNQGVAMARNRAIDEAQGQYIYFLDSDDAITPDCIETLSAHIAKENYNLAIGSYACGSNSAYPALQDAVQEYADIRCNEDFFKYKYAYTRNSLFTIYIWNILFDLNFLREHKLKFRPLRKSEDHLFFLDMMPFIQKCIILPNVTYYYILNEGSLSNYKIRAQIPAQEIIDSAKIWRDELDVVKGWSDNFYFPEIMYQQVRDALWMTLSIMRKEKIISPSLPQESMDFLITHPLPFSQIMKMKRKKLFHFAFYLIGKLPLGVKESMIRFYIRIKK